MPASTCSRQKSHNARRGAMLVFVAIVIVILFVAAALAVDIAHMHMIRAELRTATDAAARAGAESLGRQQKDRLAVQAAIDTAALNIVAGRPLELREREVVLGHNTPNGRGGFDFSPGGQPTNAVRVTGTRQAGSLSGPVPLIFAPLFGVSQFEPIQIATAGRLDRDIALVLDVSGSMAEFGRFDALKNGLKVFLSELGRSDEEEFVSLSVYNQIATKLHPLTPDLGAIDKAFSKSSPGGFTAIGLGLDKGIDSLRNDPASRRLVTKSVILMTDGNHNTGINPLAVVPTAQANGIAVHTITFSAGANQALMRDVANRTGGIHLHADTNEQLIQVFKDIALATPVTLTE